MRYLIGGVQWRMADLLITRHSSLITQDSASSVKKRKDERHHPS